ncbi:peptide chain release factor N(5)-glutamine methyltransferase [Ruania zhangjianzhongii]|uniref:peptide chain release factor N(5)-glutamine methyltransferase n=1 Tax=Ruania zhangjianzhongii TaxID=2603206 RepID=UPI0011C8DEB8|nr:peptide chain release factor N(5)-glutamine methyltransferase [Ruania zhangjianzhongii]
MTEQVPAARPAGLRELIQAATAILTEAGVGSPDVDARALAAHVLGVDRLDLVRPPELTDDFAGRYAELVERRRLREPLQQITGWAPFRYLELAIWPGVFVPRPETELVAEAAIEAARAAGPHPVVVDLCSGSGAIALALAQEVPAAAVVAVELGGEPVRAIGANADRLSLPVRVVQADATADSTLSELDARVDVLVANPPYIPPDAVPQDPEVRDHDPDLALYGGGTDGLEVPRGVVASAARLLRTGGVLVMEHAEVQAAALREIVAATGAFTEVRTEVDLTGRDRMVVATRTGVLR